MIRTKIIATSGIFTIVMLMVFFFLFTTQRQDTDINADAPIASYIVQAASLDQAVHAVRSVGGKITHELGIINAVSTDLTLSELRILQAIDGLKIHADRKAEVSGAKLETDYSTVVGATALHQEGIDGYGVTIAVIDSSTGRMSVTRNELRQRCWAAVPGSFRFPPTRP